MGSFTFQVFFLIAKKVLAASLIHLLGFFESALESNNLTASDSFV